MSLLDRHLLPTLGDHRLCDLSQAVVRDWHTRLGDTTGPTARAQAYRLLRTICNQAVRDEELASNPCQIRKAGTVTAPERTAPTLVQIHALADEVPDRHRVMILVAAYGGLRFGELTALAQADVTIPDGWPGTRVTGVTRPSRSCRVAFLLRRSQQLCVD